jgi:hypothetical protein
LGAQVNQIPFGKGGWFKSLSTSDDPIVELAKETGIPLHLWKENTITLNGDGDLVEQELANLTLKRIWDILEQAIEHSKADSEHLNAGMNLYDEFSTIAQKRVEMGEINSYERDLVLGMAQMWCVRRR